ncbi:hypothetical protein [Salinimicrobium sp. TH3]|uniref:hypothetical protein n=1 Tax=Salinimicrobium sp. TH3 TaxID=2997342 RepID=UPI002274B8D4|nr:hypothetical protein [Salinimicrobium sp. TH3]MCY2687881.1 hypothetical protein [Salinimicrobium sp. TH3]
MTEEPECHSRAGGISSVNKRFFAVQKLRSELQMNPNVIPRNEESLQENKRFFAPQTLRSE